MFVDPRCNIDWDARLPGRAVFVVLRISLEAGSSDLNQRQQDMVETRLWVPGYQDVVGVEGY